MSTLLITLMLFMGYFFRHKIHLGDGCACWSRYRMEALANWRLQTLVKVSKGGFIISWQAWRVASERLMHLSALILLVEALVRPRRYLRNSCTFWFKCNMESLANCRGQALMGDSKGAFRSSCQSWRVVPARSTVVSALILLAGALVLPQIHFRVDCTCRSRCKAWGSDICEFDACR